MALGQSGNRRYVHAASEVLLPTQQDADVRAIRYLRPRELPMLDLQLHQRFQPCSGLPAKARYDDGTPFT